MGIQKRKIYTETRRLSLSGLIIGLILPALLLAACRHRAEYGAAPAPERDIQVIAHRAGAALAPENTLAALECAVRAGADIAEIDVQMTMDGVLVAMHDGSLERTTGLCCNVWDISYTAIQAADAGAWYSSSHTGERVPTLEALLAAAKGRIRLMIEIKCTGHEQGAVERAVRLIQSAGMEQDCTLGCADLSLLRLGKTLAPALETVYIGAVTDPDLYALDYVDSYSLPFKTLTVEAVSRARSEGKKVYAWTMDTRAELLAALSFDIDGLVTDDPPLALELLRKGSSAAADGGGPA